MAWGNGCTPYKTDKVVIWQIRYGNWTGTGFLVYSDGTQAKGKYKYQTKTAYSWLVTGLSASYADAFDAGALLESGEILENLQKRRVDNSGQWHVSWDAVSLGTWTAGRFPGDTDIPAPP